MLRADSRMDSLAAAKLQSSIAERNKNNRAVLVRTAKITVQHTGTFDNTHLVEIYWLILLY